jgi:hypothetical protein
MASGPYLAPIKQQHESVEEAQLNEICCAFDCAVQGLQGITHLQGAWLQAASEYNQAILQLYQQALWILPGMYLGDVIGQTIASFFEMQTTLMRMLLQPSKSAAEFQAQMASVRLDPITDSFRSAMDMLLAPAKTAATGEAPAGAAAAA